LTKCRPAQLFEGSAVDQRAAILAKITTAKADVAAGKDGASDTLAKLLEQLNTVSKEAFGTTAQYQADRAMIADVARDAITAANQRISDAAAMATAQAQTNSALDEANDQLARMPRRWA
jgi:D-aminopeptidase